MEGTLKPPITPHCFLPLQDWLDIDFAISEHVDFIAVSFVKGPDVINNLKSYLGSRAGGTIEVIAKVESYDSVPNVPEIVAASDAVMVARGDLGRQSICLSSEHDSPLSLTGRTPSTV